MNSAANTAEAPSKNRPPAPLTILLAVVMVVFCGILIFVYVVTKRVNPVMLDQNGKPLEQHTSSEGAR